MYKLTNDVQVDVQAEINAMATYINERWDNVPDAPGLFLRISMEALHDARAWFKEYAISKELMEMHTRRQELLKNSGLEGADILPYYDLPCSLFSDMQMSVLQLREDGMNIDGKWDFSRKVDTVLRKMLAEYPTLNKARPKGWAKLAKSYSDKAGMREYCETRQFADEKAFQGADTQSGGASGFPGRTALPYVMYDDKGQGHKAHWVLVSAVYAHFLIIAEHLNTQAMLQALKAANWRDQEPNGVWELDVTSENQLVQSLIKLATEQDSMAGKSRKQAFENSLQAQREFEKKPPEEQAAIRAENSRQVLDILKSFGFGSEG